LGSYTHNYNNFAQIFVSVQVIIATPGRILDLMDKNVAIMDSCRMLVLDEVKHLNVIFFPLPVCMMYPNNMCMVAWLLIYV
jgi:hypothetical protein